MRLSREKIIHLSHVITDGLLDDEGAIFLKPGNDVRLEILRVINTEMAVDDQLDQRVRQKLGSYSRHIVEGSKEWDIMYSKLYEEELTKLGRK